MALFGSVGTLRAQAPRTEGFATAFAYLDDMLRDGSAARARLAAIEVGSSHKTPLGDGAYAVEQAYATKARADGFFEAHRKYIDVQVLLEGEEAMEVGDAGWMKIKQPYDAERDLIVYEDFAASSVLRFSAGLGAIFLPVDVHMPSLRLGAGPIVVRKVVVKVPVG